MKFYLSISKIIFFTLFFVSTFSFANNNDCIKLSSSKKIFYCLKKLALNGDSSAQFNLGVMYHYTTNNNFKSSYWQLNINSFGLIGQEL